MRMSFHGFSKREIPSSVIKLELLKFQIWLSRKESFSIRELMPSSLRTDNCKSNRLNVKDSKKKMKLKREELEELWQEKREQRTKPRIS